MIIKKAPDSGSATQPVIRNLAKLRAKHKNKNKEVGNNGRNGSVENLPNEKEGGNII
jgi:hypothetical protein